MSRYIRTLSLSDVHLGTNIGTTPHILKNLRNLLSEAALQEINLLCIVGDYWDEVQLLPDANVILIKIEIVRLLKICKKRDIVLRVLEGTKSHDRGQSKLFETLNEITGINADLRYVDTLSIEFNDKLGITILYVPDEWRSDNETTKQEVIELLDQNNLEQVDFTLLHGCMPYQAPKGIKSIPVHDPDFYLSITRKYVYIGHVHLSSVYDRILANGSFDRLSHNEESPKGMWYTECDLDGFTDTIKFIENKNASIFKTIDIINISKEEAEKAIMTVVNLHYSQIGPKGIPCFIRIKMNKNDYNLDIYNSCCKSFPLIKWSNKIVSESNTQANTITLSTYKPIAINDGSIIGLMKNRLHGFGLDENLINPVLDELMRIKSTIK